MATFEQRCILGRRFKQWDVTDYGLEALDGTCAIPAGSVSRLRQGTDLYSLPIHMAEKNWVDLPDFLSAFQIALLRHQSAQYDAERMVLTRLAAEQERRECEAFQRRLPRKEAGDIFPTYTLQEIQAAM
ncbi:hypothetical protein J8J14_23365 [Roseomonas sp. SSH11]|uniref:Uncharacterized protein n=1 Tax=Pararoseomonas baculiformis TaxID=2820812 RepID=A0ABS4AKY1_9PROT|nr:hypothetical protein [Pararoseomonas baculiformis]MBP0447697.1 hypothetical protein [Pararoseomonas baculiformis]